MLVAVVVAVPADAPLAAAPDAAVAPDGLEGVDLGVAEGPGVVEADPDVEVAVPDDEAAPVLGVVVDPALGVVEDLALDEAVGPDLDEVAVDLDPGEAVDLVLDEVALDVVVAAVAAAEVVASLAVAAAVQSCQLSWMEHLRD